MKLTEFLLARIAEDEARDIATAIRLGTESPNGGRRWLADCEAKRRIVEAFVDAEQAVTKYDHDNPTDAYWQEWGNRHALRLAVERLAAVYADHSDYDESWRP